MEDKVVTNEPTYQPCRISYLGAISGILRSLGKDHDIVNVGGYSGYTFALPNVAKDNTCPSGPTALDLDEIIKATETLGYKLQSYEDFNPFPIGMMRNGLKPDGELTPKDRERAKKLFEQVKAAIGKDRPVVLWGLNVPEYGIVKGYSSNSYIVSTYRHVYQQPDNPIRYDALQAPGWLHAIFFKKELSNPSEKDDKNAINRAIHFSSGISTLGRLLADEGYIGGFEAYETWANVLENVEGKILLYHGNNYVAECTLEAKELASCFLKRLADKYAERPQTKFLFEASEEYRKAAIIMLKFQKLFPFALSGEMLKEKCIKGAEILRSIKPHETQALSLLKKSYEVWE